MTSAVKIFTRHRAASALVLAASFRALTLAFPLEPGVYLVVNGGNDTHTNAHLMTLDAGIPRFRAWRGQSYRVDIVKLDAFGFRTRSVQVRAGATVAAGDWLGSAGNSGNTGEPHLHVHAQRPGPADAPLGGDPLPVLFGSRFPVRGDRIESP